MLTQENARIILKKLKTDYGFTYSTLAEKTGVSVSQLSLFLDNKRNLKRDKIFKLETYINTLKGAEVYEI